jgi:hypothetical protein
MRRAAKIDDNQPDIVKALRAQGCDVLSLAAIGNGCPDLLVSRPYYPHHYYLLEVKDGAKPPSARKLTPDQEKFHREWKGQIHIVTSVEEALNAVGIVRT